MAGDPSRLTGEETARRDFLKSCGRFAATVPPAMTILLSTSLSSQAIAQSVRSHPKGDKVVSNNFGGHQKGKRGHKLAHKRSRGKIHAQKNGNKLKGKA